MSRSFLYSYLLFLTLSSTSIVVLAQKAPGGGSPAGPGGGSLPSPSTRSIPSTTPSPTTSTRTSPDLGTQNIFISGKVLLDDGTPPPESLLIERVCSGTVRPEGYTDSKGRFSFQLGQNNGVLADASENTMGGRTMAGMGAPQSPIGTTSSISRSLVGCELRANLAGFRSDTVNLFGKRSMENPDVGTIVLHRLAKVEGYTFSATSAMAPKDARKAYEKGKELLKKQKLAEAQNEFLKATEAYPKFAAAWFEYGLLRQGQGKYDEAKYAYAESLKADSKFINPYQQMTRIAAMEGNWKDVLQITGKMIQLNPYFSSETYLFNAIANAKVNQFDAAEQSAREALKMDSDHRNPKINQVLGVILANKQDYSGAAENMRAYLAAAPDAKDASIVRQQLAEVEGKLGEKKDDQSKEQ